MYGGRKMKKLLIILSCVFLLGACGQKDTTKNDNNSVADDVTDTADDIADDTEDWFKRFETELGNSNIAYSTKTSIDASSIGGVEGYRYTTDNGHIDVYRFEDNNTLDEIVKNKKISVDGKDTKVEVNDHMVIVSDGVSEDVLNVFRGLK
jgi:hypothetical protein